MVIAVKQHDLTDTSLILENGLIERVPNIGWNSILTSFRTAHGDAAHPILSALAIEPPSHQLVLEETFEFKRERQMYASLINELRVKIGMIGVPNPFTVPYSVFRNVSHNWITNAGQYMKEVVLWRAYPYRYDDENTDFHHAVPTDIRFLYRTQDIPSVPGLGPIQLDKITLLPDGRIVRHGRHRAEPGVVYAVISGLNEYQLIRQGFA